MINGMFSGLEFRTLSPNDPVATQQKLEKLMDNAQEAIHAHSYGLQRGLMREWLERKLTETRTQSFYGFALSRASDETLVKDFILPDLYYPREITKKTESNPVLSKVYPNDPFARKRLLKKLEEALPRNNALLMLIHDWSQDPLIMAHPEALPQLQEVQRLAIKRVNGGEKPDESLRYFIKKSALFRLIEESLGVPH